MSKDYNNPAFKKLLQKLQEESWQLELLISGFAIFGLFSSFEPLVLYFKESQNQGQRILTPALLFVIVSCAILTFNLLLHVVLRGLWIGALGLRYVSGEIDYEELKYSPKFTNYLKKTVGSFDRYIGRLENYCSIIFAISFLLIFYVLAFFFTILSIFVIAEYLISNDSLGALGKWIGVPLLFFIAFGVILVFIDFATQGWLKKKQWLSKIYFPFYWVFSFITLSFLYRALVYNFLDNKFGRRIARLLLPLYILLLLLSSFKIKTSNYFNRNLNSSAIIANASNYEDLMTKEDDFAKNVIIPSKVITDNHLKVFLVFEDYVENDVFRHNPGLKPENDIRGLNSDIIIINEMSWRERDSIRKVYMKTLNSIYNVRIDSLDYNSEFVLTENIKKQKGFETYVSLKNLTEGKHMLGVTRNRIRRKDTSLVYVAQIPFWYFPD